MRHLLVGCATIIRQSDPRLRLAAAVAIIAIAWVFISPIVDLPFSTAENAAVVALSIALFSVLITAIVQVSVNPVLLVSVPETLDLSLIELTCTRLC
jgi:uncharacterized protein YceK